MASRPRQLSLAPGPPAQRPQDQVGERRRQQVQRPRPGARAVPAPPVDRIPSQVRPLWHQSVFFGYSCWTAASPNHLPGSSIGAEAEPFAPGLASVPCRYYTVGELSAVRLSAFNMRRRLFRRPHEAVAGNSCPSGDPGRGESFLLIVRPDLLGFPRAGSDRGRGAGPRARRASRARAGSDQARLRALPIRGGMRAAGTARNVSLPCRASGRAPRAARRGIRLVMCGPRTPHSQSPSSAPTA